MPKEFIESRWFGQYGDQLIDPEKGLVEGNTRQVPIEMSALKVGWSREAEHVELAVVTMETDNEKLAGTFAEHGDEVRYMQLDRRGINRIIATLRKARDNAFGRDE